jgi:CDGSH-type Zn-finger protein
MTDLPNICQKAPYKVDVEEGKSYFWCACGLSKAQPFCDGNHQGNEAGLKSVKYVADKTGIVYFCGCKHSKHPILCDGSHSKL